MSNEAINAVRARRFGSASRKAVMYVLADYCDAQWSCFVGQERLAAEAEVGERTVRRMLSAMEDEGLVHRAGRYGGIRGRTSDRIYLCREAIEALPAALAAREGQGVADLPAEPADLPAEPADLAATADRSSGHSLAGEPSDEPSGLDPLERSGRAKAKTEEAINGSAGARRAAIIAQYQEMVASGEASDATKAELARLESRYGTAPA